MLPSLRTPVGLVCLCCVFGCSSDDSSISTDPLDYPREVVCGDVIAAGAEVALPRNIILVVGDGMGPLQVQAGRLRLGGALSWDDLVGPVYLNTDSATTDSAANPESAATDSAASATAMATGVRVLNGVLSESDTGEPMTTVLDMARDRGKAVGLVTTSFLYDATPMAFAVHAASRNSYQEILTELLDIARPEVLLGGAGDLLVVGEPSYPALALAAGYTLVRDADELQAWDPDTAPMVLGGFDSDFVSVSSALHDWWTTPVIARTTDSTDPSLPDMSARALDRLARDADGFFLLVENEHIDTLGHDSLIERDFAIQAVPHEVIALSDSVRVILDWVAENSSFEDTLVVVTADHETGAYELYGANPDDAYYWGSGHTRTPVPLWAVGPGSDRLGSMCRVADINRLLTGQLPAR